MHGLLTTLGRGFKKRIGWKRLGIFASLLIIGFAVTTSQLLLEWGVPRCSVPK